MRKITKDLSLALEYKNWLTKMGKKHPNYTSSNNRFYYDIVANLLWVQKGLCAYTEMYLINPSNVRPENWEGNQFKKFEFLGQLDHYDPKLKEQKGWAWTNFFMIHSDINRKKSNRKVYDILKPDKPTFDPFYYLEYDFKTHNFLPNTNRNQIERKRIKHEIDCLGLNYKPIIDYRNDYLKPIIDDVLLKQITIATAKKKIKQFYTAFEMSVTSLELDA